MGGRSVNHAATRVEADRVIHRKQRCKRIPINVFGTVCLWPSERLPTRLNPRRCSKKAQHLFIGSADVDTVVSCGDSRVPIETPSESHYYEPTARQQENSHLLFHIGSTNGRDHSDSTRTAPKRGSECNGVNESFMVKSSEIGTGSRHASSASMQALRCIHAVARGLACSLSLVLLYWRKERIFHGA
jgi:hypothetical protein